MTRVELVLGPGSFLEVSVKEIPLTQGMVALVDDGDYEELSKYKWWAEKRGKHHIRYYARRKTHVDGRRINEFMHCTIMGHVGVDHKNGNGLDNRRENLRVATQAQNMANRRSNANSASSYKGVKLVNRRWRARIKPDGKPIHLGYFDTAEEAARAYDWAAKRIYGEFALLNFPEES